jgi:hypothetical protein
MTQAFRSKAALADVAMRDKVALREHRAKIRRDPRFHTAMELVRSYGRIGLRVLDDKWTAECRRMSE